MRASSCVTPETWYPPMLEFAAAAVFAFGLGVFAGSWINYRASRGLPPIPTIKRKASTSAEEPIREYGDWKL